MELTAERGIYVVSDECYLRFVYPPGEVFSAASLPAELRVAFVHRGIVFEDVCDDWMAHGICARAG